MITVIGTQPSAKALQEAVKDLPTTEPVFIHWGAHHRPDRTAFTLNNVKRLDGLAQLQKFMEVGLSCPAPMININDAKELERRGIKTFGRRVDHTRGNDIVGAGYREANRRQPERFNRGWLNREFWVPIIPQDQIVNEWRIHVFQGRVIARGLKTKTGDPIRKMPVRNRLNGWTLRHDIDPPQYIKEAARKAVAAVGYNFGAVDLFELQDNKYSVLEVNSAPALLSTYTMDAYVGACMKIAEGKYRKIYQGKETP